MDRDFVRHAAMGGTAEVELGRLAQRQGASRDVRNFGAMMVRDHSRANAELMRMAMRLRVAAPATMGPDERSDMMRLRRLRGRDFDREYKRMMVADHQKDIMEFQDEARNGRGPIAEFARKTLPTLREHLRMAQAMRP